MFWLGLLRCPLCRTRAADRRGCCPDCRRDLFQPGVQDGVLALGRYAGRLERAVRAFKYAQVRSLARLFAPVLALAVQREGWQPEVVCAVPLHRSRQGERGYNQSELLARALALELSLPYRPLLRRTRATRQQARLGRLERLENVRGAFAAAPLAGERVLLVDDVLTSGATADACRSALLAAGASAVQIAVIARA